MDGVPLGMLDGIGSVGLCVLFTIALGKGWIVTAREHRQQTRALELKDQQILEQAVQIRLLSQVGHTVEQTFRGLQDERERDPR